MTKEKIGICTKCANRGKASQLGGGGGLETSMIRIGCNNFHKTSQNNT